MGTPTQVSGDVVGDRYRIVRPIATGGYGTVYEAVGLAGGERLALKILHAKLGASPAELERFRREAALVRELGHPHIVRVLDFGETDDATPYIAFELLHGHALRQELRKRGKLGWEEAATIAAQVLDALRLAHERGVVHRDIKPSNVFLCSGGATASFVKVLDFGIAKALRGDISARTQLTQTGQLLGTPHYMAPEQVRGDALSPAADLYALGLVMAEMLSGARLAAGKSDLDVLLGHMTGSEHVLPREVRETPLGPVIEGAVRKRLDARYQSAAEMLADVQQALQSGVGAPMQDESGLAPTVATGPSVAALHRSALAAARVRSALATQAEHTSGPRTAAPVSRGEHAADRRGARRRLWIAAFGAAGLLVAAGAAIGYLVLRGADGRPRKEPSEPRGAPRASGSPRALPAWVRRDALAEPIDVPDVRRVDPAAIIPQAQRLAQRLRSGATLECNELLATSPNVEGGAIDLSTESLLVGVNITFRYPTGATRPGEDKEGTLLVRARTGFIATDAESPRLTSCDPDLGPPPLPACSLQRAWAAVVAGGMPPNALAQVTFGRPSRDADDHSWWSFFVPGRDARRTLVDAQTCALSRDEFRKSGQRPATPSLLDGQR